MTSNHILYSFRRCPYAIRARMGLAYCKISYEHREISLKKRPKSLYEISSKGTVPVLFTNNGTVIDESIDIMKWSLKKRDSKNWYVARKSEQDKMILRNDEDFKYMLDRYKYYTRYPEKALSVYQKSIASMLYEYNLILKKTKYLINENLCLVDIVLMPFIRQCAYVDIDWFNNNFKHLSKWLDNLIRSKLFRSIMHKYDIWNPDFKGVLVKWK